MQCIAIFKGVLEFNFLVLSEFWYTALFKKTMSSPKIARMHEIYYLYLWIMSELQNKNEMY